MKSCCQDICSGLREGSEEQPDFCSMYCFLETGGFTDPSAPQGYSTPAALQRSSRLLSLFVSP